MEKAAAPADSSPMQWIRAGGAIGVVSVLLLPGVAGRGAPLGVVRPMSPSVSPESSLPDTPWVAYEPSEPSAHYGSYQAARESLRILVKRSLGSWSDSATWKQTREPFRFILHHDVRLLVPSRGDVFWKLEDMDTTIVGPCLRMSYAHHDSAAPGYDEIDATLRKSGWAIDDRYDADGPDGTRFVLLCREAMVEIMASWDGGDDSDSTYTPAPGQSVTLRCVPRPRERQFPRSTP